MNGFIKKYIIRITGMVVGGTGGFAWYYFVGCTSGTCPITSNPLSAFYGEQLWVIW